MTKSDYNCHRLLFRDTQALGILGFHVIWLPDALFLSLYQFLYFLFALGYTNTRKKHQRYVVSSNLFWMSAPLFLWEVIDARQGKKERGEWREGEREEVISWETRFTKPIIKITSKLNVSKFLKNCITPTWILLLWVAWKWFLLTSHSWGEFLWKDSVYVCRCTHVTWLNSPRNHLLITFTSYFH